MKKILTTGGMLLSAVMVMVIFGACQKDQSPVSQETATSSEEAHIVGVSGSLGEGITPSYAGSLAFNYNKKYNEDGSQAQYVVFDAAVLSKFIANLQSKYGTTKIYVNFGVYGKGATAPNSKDDGRLTVFFTGDKIPAPSSRTGNDADATTDEFLNHGNIYP